MKLLISFNLFLISFWANAQIEQHLTWKSEVEKISATEFKVKFICNLDEEWHTFSQFTKEGGPLPTQFRFESNKDIELIGKVEEIGKKKTKFDELFGVDVTSFMGDATFVQKVKIKNPTAILKGEFDGQVCRDEVGCMPFGPEKFAIKFDNTHSVNLTETDTSNSTIKLSDTSLKTITITDSIQQKFDWTHAQNSCSTNDSTNATKSWLWIFIAGFIGGLFALLTPCVFPMVPLTVSYFTKGGKEKKSGVSKALMYGLSIIIIYVLLGLIITNIFGSDALNAMSTNIWFNLIFFVVFVLFALSFFGLFEITLPASWANKTDSMSSKGGYFGIFFMAFTLALVSFSCTGPIIGTLLVMGGSSLFFGLLGFGIALALPFTLFAMFPQWLQSLPKSGGWLTTVKVILGFLELALAFKFLSVV
ncbi:MAG TPA: cytochrome c biogenesis protein CcdA, partial [Chitinophagales bacterium]|nr:cytochrome c biogenesis protein CcdA [Chitinophagales bacterium]